MSKLIERKNTDPIVHAPHAPQSEPSPSAQVEVDTNSHSVLRKGLLVLLIGFGGFGLWAGFAPLDAGITADAKVQVLGNRKVVQHLEGGSVDQILVNEGDYVEEDDVLIRLNRTRAVAEQSMTATQYILAKTTEARLIAERDNTPAIEYAPELIEVFGEDPRFLEVKGVQEQLFTTRRKALEGEIGILKENLRGAQAQLDGLEQVQQNRRSQIGFIQKQLAGIRDLAKEGYVPRNRALELEREAAQLQASLSNDAVEASRARNQIAELKLRILQREQEFQSEVQTQLSEVQKESHSLADRLDSLNYTVRETDIRAPIAGYVQNVSIHTEGGVIAGGKELMEIIPKDERFIIHARVPVQSIDRLEVGLPVDITFPAFNHAQTPNIPGEVLTVSADRLEDEKTGEPYYLAQVAVTDEGMEELRGNNIRPGMPAAVLIRTGERTLLGYLLKPFKDRLDKSLKEE